MTQDEVELAESIYKFMINNRTVSDLVLEAMNNQAKAVNNTNPTDPISRWKAHYEKVVREIGFVRDGLNTAKDCIDRAGTCVSDLIKEPMDPELKTAVKEVIMDIIASSRKIMDELDKG